jgi:hypothetical protein
MAVIAPCSGREQPVYTSQASYSRCFIQFIHSIQNRHMKDNVQQGKPRHGGYNIAHTIACRYRNSVKAQIVEQRTRVLNEQVQHRTEQVYTGQSGPQHVCTIRQYRRYERDIYRYCFTRQKSEMIIEGAPKPAQDGISRCCCLFRVPPGACPELHYNRHSRR